MRSHRMAVVVTILLSLLCIASGAVGGTPTPSPTPTEGAQTHTLVITAQNGSGSYTVTASSTLQLKRGEQRDYQLGGPRISGTVGERGDTTDVIRYTGHIESFQADRSIRVTLDGRQIAPRVLGGQYIQIMRSSTASQPVRYQFGVTGRASRGALAEQPDTVSTQRIHGRFRDVDSFYFTGTIPEDTITISGPATVMINGQNASVFLSHAPPTPPATPTPTATATATASPPQTQPAPTTGPTSTPVSSPPTSHSPTATSSSPTTADSRAGSPETGLLVQLVHGLGGTLIIGIAAIVAVLYLFIGQ